MISTRKVPFKDLEIDSAGKMRASFNRLNGTVASRAGGSAEDRSRLSLHPPSEAFPKLTVLDSERVFTAQSKAQLACLGGGSCDLAVCHKYSSGMTTVRICVLTRTPRTSSILPLSMVPQGSPESSDPPQTHQLAPSVPAWRTQAAGSLNSDLSYTST